MTNAAKQLLMISISSVFEGAVQTFTGHAFQEDGSKAVVLSRTNDRKAVVHKGVSLRRCTEKTDSSGRKWRTSFMRFDSLIQVRLWYKGQEGNPKYDRLYGPDQLQLAFSMFGIKVDLKPAKGKGTWKARKPSTISTAVTLDPVPTEQEPEVELITLG